MTAFKESPFKAQQWTGACWKVAACCFYAILNVLVRYLSGGWTDVGPRLDPAQISCIQSFVAYFIVAPIIWRKGWHSFKTKYVALHGIRVVLGAAGILLLYYAFSLMPVSQAVALGFLGPIFTVILGWIYLKEPVGVFNTTGVLLGLLGAALISRPDQAFQGGGSLIIEWKTLLPLGSAFCFAITKILGRELALLNEPAHRITNYLIVFMAPLMIPPALSVWVTPTSLQWGLLMIVGIVAWLGHYCFARSYRYAGVIFLMPFGFSRLLASACLAYFLFGELPKNIELFWIGSVVVFIGALLICFEEERRKPRTALSAG